jgi:hypothetical protein
MYCKPAIIIAGLFCLLMGAGCGSERKQEEKVLPEVVTPNVFRNKVYMCAPEVDKDSAFVYGECDCCSDEIIFIGDSDLVFKSFCMSDQCINKGKYRIEKDELVLEFDEDYVEYNYNPERETDSTAVEYIVTKKTGKPAQARYKISKCKGGTLIAWIAKAPQYGMECPQTVEDEIRPMKEEGVWQVLFP